MKRRGFVKGLAATVAALEFIPEVAEGLTERLGTMARDLAGVADESTRWKRVRREFTLKPGLVHLNCGTIGASPGLVTAAVIAYLQELESDPLENMWASSLGSQTEAVRAKAAEFLGAGKDEVVLTRNTTEGMNHVASGLDLKAGDEVLTTNHEHGGGRVCWQHLARQRGVRLMYMKMPNPVRHKAQILELVESHITPRTRVCSFMHIDTITGMQMPMADISAITRKRDILLACDGAQAPGMLNVDVHALGVDTYASSSHKWMLAPKGTGLLYVRKEVQDRVRPVFMYSGYGSYSASSGTRNVPQILGHGVAMDFHNTIGRDRIEERCRQLSNHVRKRAEEISSLKLLTPADRELSSGIVSYSVDGPRNGEIVGQLSKERNIALKPAQGTYADGPNAADMRMNHNAIRISTHIFNDESDVDRAMDALKDVLG